MALSPTSSRPSGGTASPTGFGYWEGTTSVSGGDGQVLLSFGTYDAVDSAPSTDFLTLTVPTLPTLKAAGLYAVHCSAFSPSMTGAGKNVYVELDALVGAGPGIAVYSSWELSLALADGLTATPSIVAYLDTGTTLQFQMFQDTGSAFNVTLSTTMQRLM